MTRPVQLAFDGSEIVITMEPPEKGDPWLMLRLDCIAFFAALFEETEIRPAMSANGAIGLALDTLPEEVFESLHDADRLLFTPVDTLAGEMVDMVLSAPDEDDIAALEQAVRRFDAAREKAAQALARLRGGE